MLLRVYIVYCSASSKDFLRTLLTLAMAFAMPLQGSCRACVMPCMLSMLMATHGYLMEVEHLMYLYPLMMLLVFSVQIVFKGLGFCSFWLAKKKKKMENGPEFCH